MKTRLMLFSLMLTGLMVFSSVSFAQDGLNKLDKNTIGVSFALPGGGGALVGAKYFLADALALSLDFGYSLKTFEKTKNNGKKGRGNQGGFTLAPSVLFYLIKNRKVAPYAKATLNITQTPGIKMGESFSFDLGGMFGVEYFFTSAFSVGGEMGLAINIRNKFKDWSSQTGTGSLFGSFYF